MRGPDFLDGYGRPIATVRCMLPEVSLPKSKQAVVHRVLSDLESDNYCWDTRASSANVECQGRHVLCRRYLMERYLTRCQIRLPRVRALRVPDQLEVLFDIVLWCTQPQVLHSSWQDGWYSLSLGPSSCYIIGFKGGLVPCHQPMNPRRA